MAQVSFDVTPWTFFINSMDQTRWWFAPLIWAGAYAAIVLVLAYYLMGV